MGRGDPEERGRCEEARTSHVCLATASGLGFSLGFKGTEVEAILFVNLQKNLKIRIKKNP